MLTLLGNGIELSKERWNVDYDARANEAGASLVDETRGEKVEVELRLDPERGARCMSDCMRAAPSTRTHLSGPMLTTMVWPALLPPAHLAQTSIFWQRMSESLPAWARVMIVPPGQLHPPVSSFVCPFALLTLALVTPLTAEDDIELGALCRLDWFRQ